MLTGLIITVIIMLLVGFLAIYKRDMITKMFTLNVDANRSQFQQELEQTADTIIKRLENQIVHLEYLLEEADAKLNLLDQKIQEAGELSRQAAQPLSIDSTDRIAPAIDSQAKPEANELATIIVSQPVTDGMRSTSHAISEPPYSDKGRVIIAMADQGYSVTEIAKATGLGKGEIMLLLQLNKR